MTKLLDRIMAAADLHHERTGTPATEVYLTKTVHDELCRELGVDPATDYLRYIDGLRMICVALPPEHLVK